MTNSNAKDHKEKFDIDLTTHHEKVLKKIIFEERPNLSLSMAGAFGIQFIAANEDSVSFLSTEENESKVKKAFAMLAGEVAAGQHIDKKKIKAIADGVGLRKQNASQAFGRAANGNEKKEFTPKSANQKKLAEQIDTNELIFATGPAGTGKTHIAMTKAVQALKSGKVSKILLARPAQEAGEKLGFLPGDQKAKMDPYMRPLYDELDQAYGPGKYEEMIERKILEIVPVGYMRGRTFKNAFVVLDEAQNCTKEMLKMAMTRIGDGSIMVVTGDQHQIDLPNKESSGLMYYANILKSKKGVGMVDFLPSDVMRSKIVQTIVSAIDEYEKENIPEKKPAPLSKATPRSRHAR